MELYFTIFFPCEGKTHALWGKTDETALKDPVALVRSRMLGDVEDADEVLSVKIAPPDAYETGIYDMMLLMRSIGERVRCGCEVDFCSAWKELQRTSKRVQIPIEATLTDNSFSLKGKDFYCCEWFTPYRFREVNNETV